MTNKKFTKDEIMDLLELSYQDVANAISEKLTAFEITFVNWFCLEVKNRLSEYMDDSWTVEEMAEAYNEWIAELHMQGIQLHNPTFDNPPVFEGVDLSEDKSEEIKEALKKAINEVSPKPKGRMLMGGTPRGGKSIFLEDLKTNDLVNRWYFK